MPILETFTCRTALSYPGADVESITATTMMTDTNKSAIDDYLTICWRYHAKWNVPNSLAGKQVAGEGLVRLANDACLAVDALLSEVPVAGSSEDTSKKALLVSQREDRKREDLWAGRNNLVARLDKAMAEMNGEEWYYFWGLHQILNLLPQTLEER